MVPFVNSHGLVPPSDHIADKRSNYLFPRMVETLQQISSVINVLLEVERNCGDVTCGYFTILNTFKNYSGNVQFALVFYTMRNQSFNEAPVGSKWFSHITNPKISTAPSLIKSQSLYFWRVVRSICF